MTDDVMPVAELLPGVPAGLAADLMQAIDDVLSRHGYAGSVRNGATSYVIVARRKS